MSEKTLKPMREYYFIECSHTEKTIMDLVGHDNNNAIVMVFDEDEFDLTDLTVLAGIYKSRKEAEYHGWVGPADTPYSCETEVNFKKEAVEIYVLGKMSA